MTSMTPSTTVVAALSCEPTGWENQQSFSPGVCPLNWRAIEVSTTLQKGEVSNEIVSTALCCKSNYDLYTSLSQVELASLGALCVRSPKNGATVRTITDDDGRGKHIFATGPRAYPAWHIAWRAVDVKMMSPSPPDLTLDTYTRPDTSPEPQIIKQGQDDNGGRGVVSGKSNNAEAQYLRSKIPLHGLLVIALPLILVVLI